MTSAPTSLQRGNERLLWDCATVGRMADPGRTPACERLAAALGDDFSHLVLRTLGEPEPATPHEKRLRRAARDSAA